ncbi:efflux RND transporter periplasmic adaptor subunit [Shewanella sp. 202IG2-18]|uniref:efflux RND transporter periplasmic adaptor subunit n=1 Tax=Parashewanella hymeniacidonis TaxID=2807618 RepID=UPI001960CBE3|nr:efflux RND transporter periplasmic adaptor subunit [Parashewanella hymeniacidonis]MBM7074221.1 efflux RND transporter periplasmic adaptor subunit [Parashewanella hymeniacidonis]
MDDITAFIRKFITCCILVVMISACSKPNVDNKTSKTPTVEAIEIKVQPNYSVQRTFLGSSVPLNDSRLGFELAGKVIQIYADLGDKVSKGQKLATLDTALLRNQKSQVSAAMSRVEQQLNLAIRTLKRSKTMSEASFVSAQKIDEQQTQVSQLKAQLDELSAQQQSIDIKITKSNVFAPFSGQITKRYLSIGDNIAAGSPVFQLSQAQQHQAIIDVPSQSLSVFNVGESYPIKIQEIEYSGTLLSATEPLNQQTQTHQLRFQLPSSSSHKTNSVAILTVSQSVTSSGAWVPNSALTDGMRGLWNIFVLQPDASGQLQVTKRNVEVIYTSEDRSFVTGAFKNKELLMSKGTHKVAPEQYVTASHIAEAE